MESLVSILGRRKKLIIGIAIVGAVLTGAGAYVLEPLKYSATVRLLITQRASFTLDPYTAVRSTELIGQNLAQLVQTSSFLDRVLLTGYGVNQQYFALPERDRRKLWTKTIEAAQGRGTGLLEITAYHPNTEEAKKIATATAFILSTQGSEYIGRDINVRLVDPPLVSRYPVKPNLPLDILTGAFVGAVVASLGVLMKHSRRRQHTQ